MTVRYCHQCGVELSLLRDVYTSEPLGTSYQLGKFMKHTAPNPLLDVVSVFETTSEGRYRNYIVDAAASGGVELDDAGRRNIVWLAGERTGFRYEAGRLAGPTDGIKVVLSSEARKIHAFPIRAATLTTTYCARCGGLVST